MKKSILLILMSMLLVQSCFAISLQKLFTTRNIALASVCTGILGLHCYDGEKDLPSGFRGCYDINWRHIGWHTLTDEELDARRVSRAQYQFVEKFCYTFCGLYALKFGIKGFNKTRSLIQRFGAKPTLPKTI